MTAPWHILTENDLSHVADGWFRILARVVTNRRRSMACGSRLYVFRLSAEFSRAPSTEAA